jgi:hypothetical protein
VLVAVAFRLYRGARNTIRGQFITLDFISIHDLFEPIVRGLRSAELFPVHFIAVVKSNDSDCALRIHPRNMSRLFIPGAQTNEFRLNDASPGPLRG